MTGLVAEARTQLPRADVSGQDRQNDERLEQSLRAQITETQAGDLLSLGGVDEVVDRTKGGFAGNGVSGRGLDAQEASVGRKTDFAQCGQITEGPPKGEVVGVVDGVFGAQGAAFFVVLFDSGVFEVEVERGDDSFADDPGIVT